ncbi:MAG: autotransporter-associated beta strand repeat-containing protein [Verrucomicrobiota bacterium]
MLGQGTLALDYSTQNNSKLADAMVLYLMGGNLSLAGGSHVEVVGSATAGAGMTSLSRSGSSSLRLNAIARLAGGTLDFGSASMADTDTANVNGILGGYATLAGADWAINSTGLGDGAITAYTGYTDIAATGSTIANSAASNVRLNSAGGGGDIALGAATTTVNTLLQSTATAATVDTSTGILRLGAVGGILVAPTAQSLTLGTAVDSGFLTAGGADNTVGEIVAINNSANALTINSTITNNGSGAVSFTKSGTGNVTLNGNNQHTGTNFIGGGTLTISSATNLGAAQVVINGGTLNITASTDLSGRVISLGGPVGFGGGTISVASGQTVTDTSVIQNNALAGGANPSVGAANSGLLGMFISGSLTKTGNGTLVLGGANTYNFGTTITGGALSIGADNNLGATPTCYFADSLTLNGGALQANATFTLSANRGIRLGPVNGSGSGTILVDDSQTLTFGGQLSDNWNGTGSFVKNGNGILVLSGSVNDYSGDTTVSGGILQLNHSRALPNGAGKGNLVNNGTVNINGVNVQLNGLSGSGTVDNTSATAITLGIGNNNQSSSFAGNIENTGGGALALSKVGSATLTITGSANHTGSTLINAGTLALSGSATIGSTTNIVISSGTTLSASGLSGGTLTLNFGQTVSGVGAVTGTLNTGGGTLAPGSFVGGAGTITVANLTLGSGSSLTYDLANVTNTGAGLNDFTVVSGTLNVAGPVTLNLNYLNALPASSGKYTLFSYTTFSGNVNDITVPSGFTINNNTSAKTIELLINHTPVSLTWSGDGIGNVWDVNTTANWNAGAATFFNGDSVTFNDTGSDSPAVNISTPVIPAAVTVNASSKTYDFTGSSISSGSLTKSGSSPLILENDNTFTAGGIINAGTVQIGNGGGTGSLTGGALTNNGAIVVNRTGDVALTNNISGTGTFTQNNTGGTAALAGSNSYSGLTLVSAGRVYARNGSAFGATSGGTTVNADAQIYIDQNVNFDAEPLTLNGGGLNSAGDGALRKGGGGVSIFGGPVTLGSDTTIALDGGATLNFTNATGMNGANVNLQLAGASGSAGSVAGPIALGSGSLTNAGGTWTVASNNYTGNTFLNGGTLRISSPFSVGTPPVAWTADRVQFNGGSLGVASNANITFDDGKVGFAANVLGSILVDGGATITMSNEISGTASLIKGFPGTLILKGSNSFSGVLYLDRGVDGNNNDGITRITKNDAVANVVEIRSRNSSVNTAGGATLQLDGSAENLNLLQPVWFSCRQDAATNSTIQNLAGSNTLSGNFTLTSGGNWIHIQTDAGSKLAIAGQMQYNDTLLALRNLHFRGEGDTLVAGDILLSANATTPVTVIKSGTGKLTLAGNNTYSDITVVSNGVLLLTGSINSTGAVRVAGGTFAGTGSVTTPANMTVEANGSLAPGNGGIGDLTINNNLTLAGTTVIEVNKTANTTDRVLGVQALTYGGTLFATNLSGTLNLGDSFTVFTPVSASGNFTAITGTPGTGKAWSFNPATGILSVVVGIASNPTNITFSVSGSTLSLSWPTDHLGWILQAQTNSLTAGLGTNWVDVAGTAAVTSTNLTINPANPTVFFRLRYP